MHVRRKFKENEGEMKKSKELIIKRIQSISLEPLVSLVLELVSERRRAPRGEGKQESKGRTRKAREGQGRQRKQGKVGSGSFTRNTCR